MKRDFSLLAGKQFDLLVCGGGIYGAWTAYDAALRGLRVVLVEQGDWAGATSSASSKLIHGGLRYLETYDFRLVRKAVLERQRLLELAPHRVWPMRFGVPIYRHGRLSWLQLKAGLALYDLFAVGAGRGSGPLAATGMAHRQFNQQAFAARFPAVKGIGLKGGFTYADAQTDDARLVLELVAGARAAGAVCVNYCKLIAMHEMDSMVSGAAVVDQVSGHSGVVSARQIVMTTGQWTTAATPGRDWCRLSKGVHLVMPAVLTDEALLLTAQSDGRVFFLIPWYGRTLLGTTDTDYRGPVENIAVEPEEIAYLLEEANHYLSTAWTEQDVIGSFAGLRVMKRSGHASPSDASRDWELRTLSNGVHYSIGGKITSAREDAAFIVNRVCSDLGRDIPCATKNRLFPWAPEMEFAEWSSVIFAQADELGLARDVANWLMRRHGKRAGEILAIVDGDPSLAERIVPGLPLIYADLLYCVRHEMVLHLEDMLRRRMPLLILEKLDAGLLYRIAELVAAELGWDQAAIEREVTSCLK